MLRKIILALQRWFALQCFPRNVSKKSYIFFDYYVPLGGAHDRIMIYDLEGKSVLSYESIDPLNDSVTNVIRELPLEVKKDLFRWLKNRFQSETNMLLTKLSTDPVKLRLFARDTETGWNWSISVSDVQCHEELRSIRYEFIERVKRSSSVTGFL